MVKIRQKLLGILNSTKLFIDLSLEQVKKGKRKGTGFKNDGWEDMGKGFTEMAERIYENSRFKNKYDSMRKEWTTWHKLIHETGVGWDNEKNINAAIND